MTAVNVTGPPSSRLVSNRMLVPALWSKKNRPIPVTTARPTVPTSSTDAPMLLIHVAARTPIALITAPMMIITTPNSWIWPRVGSSQIYGANTEPIAIERPAVPAVNASIAAQPVNHP